MSDLDSERLVGLCHTDLAFYVEGRASPEAGWLEYSQGLQSGGNRSFMATAEVLLPRKAGEGDPMALECWGLIACLGFAANPKSNGEPLECFVRGLTDRAGVFRRSHLLSAEGRDG